jgi:hypothetical protein
MTDKDTDNEGTPDTVLLEQPFSPRTAAKYKGDFARLIPINRAAILAFHAIAQKSKLDPEWNPHARRFLHVEDIERDLTPEWDSSDTQTDGEEGSQKIWTG